MFINYRLLIEESIIVKIGYALSSEEQLVICGNDPKKHLKAIQKYIDLAFDHINVHQIGPYQDSFFKFYQQHILPEFVGQVSVGA
jgi:hypothetical protein